MQAAWALLLRAYLSKDVISFVHVTDSHEGRVFAESNARTSLDATEAFLYQYQSPEERQLREFGPYLVRPLTQHDFESVRVNTAVALDLQNSE